ncbi:transposase [Sphingobacterium faecium]|uniref:transposase n=1 Tax=Sphingobacterium faecium TaxID=34087 RepID=UPI0024686589|nr:transposase [Sphingobacterium faecium]MDH5825793.1 transposase [Sphingobacterium faecium]
MKTQYCYPKELKVMAIEMVIGLGMTRHKVAESLGVTSNTVEAWVKLYQGNPVLAMKVRQSKINTPEIVGDKTK